MPETKAAKVTPRCVKCGHVARRWHGYCQWRASEDVLRDPVCGCECKVSAAAPQRFKISYRDGAYFVSIPRYHGGEVVNAELYDSTRTQLAALEIRCKQYDYIVRNICRSLGIPEDAGTDEIFNASVSRPHKYKSSGNFSSE